MAKPTAAIVFGILNIIFGVLGVCGMIWSLAMLFIPNDMQANNPVYEIMRDDAGYRAFLLITSLVGSVFTIILIVAGIGLLMFKPYGRTLSMVYAVYGIVKTIVGTIGNYIFLAQPLMERSGGGPEQAAAVGGAIGGMVGGCIALIYPVVLLIFMMNTKFIEAMRQYNAGGAAAGYAEPWQQPANPYDRQPPGQ